MTTPTSTLENKLRGEGYAIIAGVDEVGRGAWAGPLVAAAVVLPENARHKLRNIKDSKLLNADKRNEFFKKVTAVAIDWNIAYVSVETIDAVGVGKANHQAMIKAIEGLRDVPEIVLVDGHPITCEYTTKAIVKGDRDVVTITAASILAKVARDRMMVQFDKQFPAYGFAKHKGYGTALHQNALRKEGVTPLHRKSYKPIQLYLEQ